MMMEVGLISTIPMIRKSKEDTKAHHATTPGWRLLTSSQSGKECVSPISGVIVQHVSTQKYILYDGLLKLVKTFLFLFLGLL